MAAVSSDGNAATGGLRQEIGLPFFWTKGAGAVTIPPPQSSSVSPSNYRAFITGDGGRVVGTFTMTDGSTRPFSWAPGDANSVLLPLPTNTVVLAMTPDGRHLVLQESNIISLWTDNVRVAGLEGQQIVVSGITPDGNHIYGQAFIAASPLVRQGVLWTSSGGVTGLRVLDSTSTSPYSYATSSNADASVLGGFGGAQNAANMQGIVWTSSGPQGVKEYLVGKGLGSELDGWIAQSCRIGPDGRSLVVSAVAATDPTKSAAFLVSW